MCTVAGVVGNVRQNGFAKNAPLAIYMPDTQAPVFLLDAAAFVVRTEADPQTLANTFRRELDLGVAFRRRRNFDGALQT